MHFVYLFIILGVLAGGAYKVFNDQMVRMEFLAAEKATLEVKAQEQEAALQALEASLTLQREATRDMELHAANIQEEMNGYLQIFKDHDFTRLARAKPGLIETRANKATDNIFTVMEDDTKKPDNSNNSIDDSSNDRLRSDS
jgi:cobalamin biosynthesis protein CbiD